MAAPTCKVYRDGKISVINSKYLTIGDIVVLEAGDRIPARWRIYRRNWNCKLMNLY